MFLGHENIDVVVVHGYDEKLSLTLLKELNICCSCLTMLKKLLIFVHEWILKVHFTLQ